MTNINISFCSYFSPCSSQHYASKDFKNLSSGKKFVAVLAAAFGGLLSLPMAGLGGVAAFRKCVYLMSPSQKSANKTHQALQRLNMPDQNHNPVPPLLRLPNQQVPVPGYVQQPVPVPETQDVVNTASGSLSHLEALIPTIEDPNKVAIYNQAVELYKQAGCQSTLRTRRLMRKCDFVLDEQREPKYLQQIFTYTPDSNQIGLEPKFYDYARTEGCEDVLGRLCQCKFRRCLLRTRICTRRDHGARNARVCKPCS